MKAMYGDIHSLLCSYSVIACPLKAITIDHAEKPIMSNLQLVSTLAQLLIGLNL